MTLYHSHTCLKSSKEWDKQKHTCFPSCLQLGQPYLPLNWVILNNAALAGKSAKAKSKRALHVNSPCPLTATFTPIKIWIVEVVISLLRYWDYFFASLTQFVHTYIISTFCCKTLQFLYDRSQAVRYEGFLPWTPHPRQKHVLSRTTACIHVVKDVHTCI